MINDYASLKTTIADFLARDDMTAKIPVFIQLAEAEMNRVLDTREQERRVQATVAKGVRHINMPANLHEFRMVRSTSPKEQVLEFCSLDAIERDYGKQEGAPKAYSIVSDEIRLAPIPNEPTTIEMVFTEDFASLSDSVATNRLLLRNPDIYLHGALKHAHVFLLDEARAQYHGGLFDRAVAGAAQDAEASRFGQGPLTIKQR